MSRSVKRCLLGTLMLVFFAAFACWWHFYYRTTLHSRYERIQIGMSGTEVELVLQHPPGDYRTKPINHPSVRMPAADFASSQCWAFDEGSIYVFFDGQERVVAKRFSWPPPSNQFEGFVQQHFWYPLDER